MTRPIQANLRDRIANDPRMTTCIYVRNSAPNHLCRGRITWEHAWIYAGKQINEQWAIIPCCEAHNSGEAMDKNYNRYIALSQANLEEVKQKYPKKDWGQELKKLKSMYERHN